MFQFLDFQYLLKIELSSGLKDTFMITRELHDSMRDFLAHEINPDPRYSIIFRSINVKVALKLQQLAKAEVTYHLGEEIEERPERMNNLCVYLVDQQEPLKFPIVKPHPGQKKDFDKAFVISLMMKHIEVMRKPTIFGVICDFAHVRVADVAMVTTPSELWPDFPSLGYNPKHEENDVEMLAAAVQMELDSLTHVKKRRKTQQSV